MYRPPARAVVKYVKEDPQHNVSFIVFDFYVRKDDAHPTRTVKLLFGVCAGAVATALTPTTVQSTLARSDAQVRLMCARMGGDSVAELDRDDLYNKRTFWEAPGTRLPRGKNVFEFVRDLADHVAAAHDDVLVIRQNTPTSCTEQNAPSSANDVFHAVAAAANQQIGRGIANLDGNRHSFQLCKPDEHEDTKAVSTDFERFVALKGTRPFAEDVPAGSDLFRAPEVAAMHAPGKHHAKVLDAFDARGTATCEEHPYAMAYTWSATFSAVFAACEASGTEEDIKDAAQACLWPMDFDRCAQAARDFIRAERQNKQAEMGRIAEAFEKDKIEAYLQELDATQEKSFLMHQRRECLPYI